MSNDDLVILKVTELKQWINDLNLKPLGEKIEERASDTAMVNDQI